MIKIGNPNHPKKGSTIKVEPIKKQKDIKAIKKMLARTFGHLTCCGSKSGK